MAKIAGITVIRTIYRWILNLLNTQYAKGNKSTHLSISDYPRFIYCLFLSLNSATYANQIFMVRINSPDCSDHFL